MQVIIEIIKFKHFMQVIIEIIKFKHFMQVIIEIIKFKHFMQVIIEIIKLILIFYTFKTVLKSHIGSYILLSQEYSIHMHWWKYFTYYI